MVFLLLTSTAKSDIHSAEYTSEDLIARIANGDQKALAELYSQTKTMVYGFALSILRNKHDAEDIMQDTYVKIYASAKEYRSQGKATAWILTITRNLSLMKLRAGKRTDAPTEELWDPPDTHDSIEGSINRLVLETAMTTLSDEERQIIMLHAVTGQKHREIAALLQMPLSTTLSKYHRGLSKLKKLLKEDE
mgnify:CR=1 FL=1|jgi:RNA polymerase sigma-70 factor (ECF subfamily)